MKIFIPFKLRDTGGTSSFARKFKEGLEKRGHEVFFDFRDDYDILFVIVQCPFKYLLHAKKNKKKIIHRLDGTYSFVAIGWKYWLMNLPPKIIHLFFSDFTVYQSQYSKYCSEKFLGKKSKEKFKIIYNGVNLKKFKPNGEKFELKENPQQQVFITISRFRRKDQIIPIIESLKIYKNKYTDNFKLLVIGDFSGQVKDIPEKFKNFSQIKFMGKIKNEELPKYERSSDVFLFTHLNPPCPNNIIEAMACGLPICGVNDGSMQEITKPGKNSLLIKTKGDAFWKKRDYDLANFAKNLNEIISQKETFSKNSRKIAVEKFSLKEMTKEYLKIF